MEAAFVGKAGLFSQRKQAGSPRHAAKPAHKHKEKPPGLQVPSLIHYNVNAGAEC